MAAGLPVNIAGFANEIANIVGINDWNLQEATYNGALFHWMQPSFNGINPLAGLINYVNSDPGTISQKPPYGTWSNIMTIKDTIKRKLCVFPVPNYNGYYIEDFGSTGAHVDIIGIVYGADYLNVLTKCLQLFNDSQVPGSNPPVGVFSKNNFRQFVHPVFGNTNLGSVNGDQVFTDVYFVSYELITSSDKWRAASFRMQLIVQNPYYLTIPSTAPSWQSEVQILLNLAQNVIISINQAFSLIESETAPLPPFSQVHDFGSVFNSSANLSLVLGQSVGSNTNNTPLPVITGRGLYINSIDNIINTYLTNITNVFKSSMAFFVQNSASQIQNSYWTSIVINYSLLPVYLTSSQIFSYSDAQAILTNYADIINNFVLIVEQNGYTSSLQQNIQAIKNSIVYLNNVAELFLEQNRANIVTNTTSQSDLYSLMFQNDADINNFPEINDLNRGSWFSCLKIPAGTQVNLS